MRLQVMCGGYQKNLKSEDRFINHTASLAGDRCYFMLVADGHGGKDAAQLAAQRILPLIAQEAGNGSGAELNRACVKSFRTLHEEICASGTTAGSTLTVCCINASRQELHVWNVGDSLAVLVDADGHAPLGVSHRLGINPDEQSRLQALGVKLGRAMTEEGKEGGPLRAWPGGLAVTRAIGDADCMSYVIPAPVWSKCPVPPKGGALLACTDGVWDLMSADEAATILLKGEYDAARDAARQVVRKAVSRGLVDDTTAAVMLFGPVLEDDDEDDGTLATRPAAIPESQTPPRRARAKIGELTIQVQDLTSAPAPAATTSQAAVRRAPPTSSSVRRDGAVVGGAVVGGAVVGGAVVGGFGSTSVRRIRKLSGDILFDLPPKEDDKDDSDEFLLSTDRALISPSTQNPLGSQNAKLELHQAPRSVRASIEAGPSSEAGASLDQRLVARRLSDQLLELSDSIRRNSDEPQRAPVPLRGPRLAGSLAPSARISPATSEEMTSAAAQGSETPSRQHRGSTSLGNSPASSRASNTDRNSLRLSTIFDSFVRDAPKAPGTTPPWAGSTTGRRSLNTVDRFGILTSDAANPAREAWTPLPGGAWSPRREPNVDNHRGSDLQEFTRWRRKYTADGDAGTRVVDFSKLTISRYLGEGEFARAHQTTLDERPAAIKMLKKEKREIPSAVEGLKREIMMMTLMDHPNVLKAYALGQHEGIPLMIVELLSRTLPSQLPRDPDTVPVWVRWREVKRWPLSRSLHCAVQLARALKYCHDDAFPGYRVLHRDVKPNNIGFIHDPEDPDHLVLFDFGLAKLWGIKNDPSDTLARNLTGETGSLRYMAPEVANSRPYCPKAEVFSFATVTYEIASCEKPFSSMLPDQFRRAIGKGYVPEIPRKWPAELQSLISECWKLDAQQRPEFREIVPRLEALCAEHPQKPLQRAA
jgi:serine/threonine protein phosphatase PrpC